MYLSLVFLHGAQFSGGGLKRSCLVVMYMYISFIFAFLVGGTMNIDA